MKLPTEAPPAYNKQHMESLLRSISDSDKKNVKADQEWNPRRFVLTDETSGTRYRMALAGGRLKFLDVLTGDTLNISPQGWFNVQDYHRSTDTSGDYSAAAQRAADAAFAVRGGKVFYPPLTGGYVQNTEVSLTGTVNSVADGWRAGGVWFEGCGGFDRNSINGGTPDNSIRKESGTGGLFKFNSIDNSGIDSLSLIINGAASADYIVNATAADSPNITGNNFGLKNVELQTHTTATADAQVVLTSIKQPWLEDVYWTDGQSDALRIGDNAAGNNTLVTGRVYDLEMRRCRLQGDVNMRNVSGLTAASCEFWKKRASPAVTRGIQWYASGDQVTNNIVWLRNTADNDGDSTGTLFTQGTSGRDFTDIGGVYGEYASGFVLPGTGQAIFLGTRFTVMATTDIKTSTGSCTLRDWSDALGTPSAGHVS